MVNISIDENIFSFKLDEFLCFMFSSAVFHANEYSLKQEFMNIN